MSARALHASLHATLLAWMLLSTSNTAAAQSATPSRLAVDTVVAGDTTRNGDGTLVSGVVADAMVSAALGRGFQAITRPFLQRLGTTREWNAQLWIAALRYEHGTRRAVRIDAGYIPSPVGMANLLIRPHTNPTTALPASLFTPLPLLDASGPRTTLLGNLYPLGISATVSTVRWDARAAFIDTSPLRARRVFADLSPPNPPRLPTIVFGGGLTPVVGVRVGASVARGIWERVGEGSAMTSARRATVTTLEADIAYRHTHVQGEWTRDHVDTGRGTISASGWFIQGEQALAPRWFVTGRAEQIGAPAPASIASVNQTRQRLVGTEETLGYRLTRELTIRLSHRMRRGFGRIEADHATTVSMVWWRRWL